MSCFRIKCRLGKYLGSSPKPDFLSQTLARLELDFAQTFFLHVFLLCLSYVYGETLHQFRFIDNSKLERVNSKHYTYHKILTKKSRHVLPRIGMSLWRCIQCVFSVVSVAADLKVTRDDLNNTARSFLIRRSSLNVRTRITHWLLHILNTHQEGKKVVMKCYWRPDILWVKILNTKIVLFVAFYFVYYYCITNLNFRFLV